MKNNTGEIYPPPPAHDSLDSGHALIRDCRIKAVTAVVMGAWALTAQAFDFSVVAYSGQPAVGAPSGTYSGFSPKPALGDNGKVCYAAAISGESSGDPGNGLWLGDASATQVILLGGLNGTGDPAPDTAAGTTFVDVINEKIVANGSGQAAFLASVNSLDPSLGPRAIYASLSDTLHLVAQQGQPAPGTLSTFTGSFDYIALNDAGQVAFDDRFEGNARYGIWMGLPGAAQVVALSNEQAPGFANGVTFNTISPTLALNNNGQVGFFANVSSGKEAIYFGSPNNIAPVVMTGQAAPGTSDTFSDFGGHVDINDNGDIGFLAHLQPSNRNSVWFNLTLIAARGTTSPDLPPGYELKTFITSGWQAIINDHNQIVFLANDGLTTSISASNIGLWIATSGSLALIAREGAQPPGLPVGTAFSNFENIYLNNRGQVAFDGIYTGTLNGRALFATDGTATPQLVAKVGDPIMVGGVLKTYSAVSLFSTGSTAKFSGSSDGRPSSFNNSGDLIFNATFAGPDTAIIKTNIPAVQTNNPPQLTLGTAPGGAEGENLLFNATFTDADAGDTHTASIAWGDGTSTPINPATSPINANHTYADNGNYTVQLTVTDSAGASVQQVQTAVVVNVAPTVDNGLGQPLAQGETFNLSASFSDPGSADTHSAVVSWGDNSTNSSINPATSPLNASHVYTTCGSFTVTVTVTDDDGDSGSDTSDVIVGAPLDLDIAKFTVPKVGTTLVPTLDIKNNGCALGSATARVSGAINGTLVYSEALPVSDAPGDRKTTRFTFPAYTPVPPYSIVFTTSIEDADPDTDLVSVTKSARR